MKESILVVDDEIGIPKLFETVLKSQGFNVTATLDSRKALDFLSDSAEKYDLLITDLQMPVIDGVSLAEKAKAINPDIKIICITCSVRFNDLSEEKKGLFDQALYKPFNLDKIKATIKHVVIEGKDKGDCSD